MEEASSGAMVVSLAGHTKFIRILILKWLGGSMAVTTIVACTRGAH
jgi:hypothetical protein